MAEATERRTTYRRTDDASYFPVPEDGLAVILSLAFQQPAEQGEC
ncbi:MAG TPA: hypothetical protein VFS76_05930 [Pyrinomonadaceae bacterium]|nr:hypothetical protein [Pyrinomonadaceae bacterium]